MILITGVIDKNLNELARYLRVQLQEKVYIADDINQKELNILIRLFEEEEVKEMFKKHKPRIVINMYGKRKHDFDQYKYQVAVTRNLSRFIPKNCKLIYISTTDIYEKGIEPFTETSSLNPHNPFEICKVYGETVTKEKTNHCILRINNNDSQYFNLLKQGITNIIKKDLRGIYNLSTYTNIDCTKYKEAVQ